MYAIIEANGKQYSVKEGQVIDIDRMETPESSHLTFNNVLFLHDGNHPHVGTPYVKNCLVQAELLEEIKGPKVIAYKYKKRKNYRRKVGHRQLYSRVKIVKIQQNGG